MRVVILCVLAAIGMSAARADSPQSGLDWSSDQFLLGAWSCDLARPDRQPAHEHAVYSMGLAGRWLKLTYTLTSDDPNTPALTTDAYESFDPALNKWIYVSMSSDGNYGMAYSGGWEAGTKTYGPAPDAKEKWRLIATKVNDREFTEDIDILVADGQWSRTTSLRCKRAD